MRLRKLGRTDASVSIIGQGTTGTGPLSAIDVAKDRQRIRILQQGIELGMNFIDTAELYGGGHAEELVGEAITGRRSQVFLASKFNPNNNRPSDMEHALSGSLKRLKTDYLDLYQMHWSNPAVPLEDTLAGMTQLVEKGIVRYIGLSNVPLPELEWAVKNANIASVQYEYNLTERSIESKILPFCKQHSITVLAYSPLDRGRNYDQIPALATLSKKYGITNAQLMLNWAISHESVIGLTMTTNPAHLFDAISAVNIELDKEDITVLEESTKCPLIQIMPREISVKALSYREYETLNEAILNERDLIPYPVELAKNIQKYEIQKPIRIKKITNNKKQKMYELVSGNITFWAWVIAFGWESPLPAYELTK